MKIKITIEPSNHGYYVYDQRGGRCGFLSTSRTLRQPPPDGRGYDDRKIRHGEYSRRVILPRLR